MTVPPATVVRETCCFSDEESPSIIEVRIAATKARALEIAAREGVTRPHFSEIYSPMSEDDLNWSVTAQTKPARNWREALRECHWGRFAQYTAVVRNQDYCDYLDAQRA